MSRVTAQYSATLYNGKRLCVTRGNVRVHRQRELPQLGVMYITTGREVTSPVGRGGTNRGRYNHIFFMFGWMKKCSRKTILY